MNSVKESLNSMAEPEQREPPLCPVSPSLRLLKAI